MKTNLTRPRTNFADRLSCTISNSIQKIKDKSKREARAAARLVSVCLSGGSYFWFFQGKKPRVCLSGHLNRLAWLNIAQCFQLVQQVVSFILAKASDSSHAPRFDLLTIARQLLRRIVDREQITGERRARSRPLFLLPRIISRRVYYVAFVLQVIISRQVITASRSRSHNHRTSRASKVRLLHSTRPASAEAHAEHIGSPDRPYFHVIHHGLIAIARYLFLIRHQE